jgi:ribosomal protein L18E
VNAQEKTIVQLLNSQLQKEMKLYPNEDSLVVLQPFKINEKKELSVKLKRTNVHIGESEIITRKVNLSKIKSLVKDINVLFETEGDAVIIVTTTIANDGTVKPETTMSYDLFFTEINKDKGNEDFRDKLITAFKKAGYKIDCTIWAD